MVPRGTAAALLALLLWGAGAEEEEEGSGGADEAGRQPRRAGAIPPECQDPVAGWKDLVGWGCDTYDKMTWCNRDGSMGPRWPYPFSYDILARGGHSAKTACCACGACPSCRGCDNPLPLQKPEHFTEFASFGCSHVGGRLSIRPKSDADMEALAGLESISGDFFIFGGMATGGFSSTTGLSSFSALGNLSTVGGTFYFSYCRRCVSFDGLESLQSIGGGLHINACEQLASLDALRSLTSVGFDRRGVSIQLYDLPALENLRGLVGLAGAMSGIIWIQKMHGLRSLEGLEGLTSLGVDNQGNSLLLDRVDRLGSLSGLDGLRGPVAGSIGVINASALRSLRALGGVTSIKNLVLRNASVLGSLDGLQNLRSINVLLLEACPQLPSLQGLEGLRSVGDTLGLLDLRLLRSLSSLANLTGPVGGGLRLQDLPLLASLEGLGGVSSLGVDSGGASLYIRRLHFLSSLSALGGIQGHLPGSVEIHGANALRSLGGLGSITSAGGLHIEGVAVETLDGLGSLKSLHGGQLVLRNLPALTSIEALGNLSGGLQHGLVLDELPVLGSLDPLVGVTHIVAGDGAPSTVSIEVRRCAALRDLSGLAGLRGRVLGKLKVESCGSLRSLQGLEGVTMIAGVEVSNCPKLESLAAFGGLRRMFPSLRFASLPMLQSLHGLEGVTSTELSEACACQGCQSLAQSSLSVSECPQLRSIAALGSISGGIGAISIVGAPSLLSLQGIEGLLARTLALQPGPQLCVTEGQRRHLEALPAAACGGAAAASLIRGYSRAELPASAGACSPCEPPCGRLPSGQPVECDLRRGECRCPLGTRGPGCREVLPRVGVAPSQSFECLLQAASAQRGRAVCSVRVALVRTSGMRNSSGPTRLAVYGGDGQSAHPNGPNTTASHGHEYDSVAAGNVTWHNATHGEVVMQVALRRRSTYDGRRTVLHAFVGYELALAPDGFLEGTILQGPLTSPAPRIYPWCLGPGAGCRRTAPVPLEVGFCMSGGTVRFMEVRGEVLESQRVAVAVLERVGGDEGMIWVAVEADLAASTATRGVDFHFDRKVIRWADEDAQKQAILVTLVDDAVWEPSETIVLRIVAVSHSDVRDAANQEYRMTLLDDGDGGELRLRSAASIREGAGDAGECLVTVERSGGSSGDASVEVVLEPSPVRCGIPPEAAAVADGPAVAFGVADFSFARGRRLTWADGANGTQCAFGGPGAARLTVYSDYSAEENEVLCLRLADPAGTAQVQTSAARSLVTILDGGTGGERGSYLRCDRGSCSCAPGWYANSSARADECWPCEPGHRCEGGWRLTPCGPGSFAEAGGATECDLCRAGTFQARAGASSCAACPGGTFGNSSGASACARCDDVWGVGGFATASALATSPADCACPPGHFLPCTGGGCPAGARPPEGGCRSCPKGFSCRGGLEPLAGPRRLAVGQAPGALVHAEPLLEPGCFASPSAPYCALRCGTDMAEKVCPGLRRPGFCGGSHRKNALACGSCESGYYSAAGECVPCEGGALGFLPLLLGTPVVVLALAVVAHSVNRDQSKQRLALVAYSATLSLALFSVQALSTFGRLSMSWIDPAKAIMGIFTSIFDFEDLKIMQVECSVEGEAHLASFMVRLGITPLVVLLALAVVAARTRRKGLADFRAEATQTVGTLVLVFFIFVLATTVKPFIVFVHFCDGRASLKAYPNVFVGSDEHVPLAVLGVTALVLIPLAFVAVCVWATWRVSGRVAQGDTHFLRSYRFLFGRFHHEAYYYSLVQLARNALLSLVPVLIRDNINGQILMCMSVITLPLVVQVRLQPWRISQMNHLETIVLVVLLHILFFGSLLTEAPSDTSDMQRVFLVAFVVLLVAVLLFLAWATTWAMRPHARFAFFVCHAKGDAGTRARALQLKLVQQSRWPNETFIDADHLFNLDTLFETVRSEVCNLVVLLSRSILTRPWCAGEIATAVRNGVPIIPVRCSDFVPPENVRGELAGMFDYSASGLAEYEIAPEDIALAYERLLETSCIVPEQRLGNKEMEALTEQIFAVAARVQRRQRQPKAAEQAGHPEGRPRGKIAILTEVGDAEGAAGATILFQLLLPHLEGSSFLQVESCMSPHSPQELLDYLAAPRSSPGACHTAVILLSRGTLASPDGLAVILQAMQRFKARDLNVVSVALPGFAYPAGEFYERELPRLLESLPSDLEDVAETVRDFFKLISVPLSTHGSKTVLEAQTMEVLKRLQVCYRPSAVAAGGWATHLVSKAVHTMTHSTSLKGLRATFTGSRSVADFKSKDSSADGRGAAAVVVLPEDSGAEQILEACAAAEEREACDIVLDDDSGPVAFSL